MRSPRTARQMLVTLLLLACGALATGCATAPTKPTTMRIEPGAYSAAFEAVKDELRSIGFELDRIDARAGVITTRPHFSAGLATPWVGDESTIEQEFEGLLNRQRRTVRVEFAPAEAGDEVASAATDTRELGAPIRARVTVSVERMHRSGLQVSPVSVRLSRVMIRDEPEDGEPQPWTMTRIGDDEMLAARIVDGVARRVAQR